MLVNPVTEIFSIITVRACAAFLSAFFIWIFLGARYIEWLKAKQMGQTIREEGLASHYAKKGTPTLGGGLIIFAVVVAMVMWVNWSHVASWLVLAVFIATGALGWLDDYLKVVLKHNRGLPSRQKFLGQSLIAVIAAIAVGLGAVEIQPALTIPFLIDTQIPLGPLWYLLAYFVITGTSNAVNLTDGLDGLAGGITVLVASGLGVVAYAAGDPFLAENYGIHYIQHGKELSIICAALAGANLGFLWFNAPKALVFMGDVGSLAIGAALGMIALLLQQEILLFIMGFVFVVETLSVIIQVMYFKITKGKRIFKMSPIHHHFEMCGWPETRVTIRFWIVSVLCVLIGLTVLFS